MILITRPIKLAQSLQNQCSKIGLDTFIEPLSEIHLKKYEIQLKEDFNYIITSQNTVEYLKSKKLNNKIKKINFFIVGDNTARKLSKLGSEKITYIAKNTKDLLHYIKKENLKNKWVYLCGSNKNRYFFSHLKKLNSLSIANEVYNVYYKEKFSSDLIQLFYNQKIKNVFLFSKVSAILFLKLCQLHEVKNYKRFKYVCISQEVQQLMLKNSCKNATFSDHATEKSMVKKMSQIVEVS